MLPSKNQIARIRVIAQKKAVKNFSSKNRIHYGVFLLCYGAGLRVSEAINFDYKLQVNGLYLLRKAKGAGVRYGAVSNKIVNELKEVGWKTQQTNRYNFAKYCQKLKQEAKLPVEVELTPHTGRRIFATYAAENGTPLPLLANMLGHKSKKTTAEYYWHNIYNNPNLKVGMDKDKFSFIKKEIFSEQEKFSEQLPAISSKELQQNIFYGQKLVEKTNIFSPVKSKEYWKEYNAKRKEYLQQYYLKKSKENKNKLKEQKPHFTTNLATLQEKTAYQEQAPPSKSRLEMSK